MVKGAKMTEFCKKCGRPIAYPLEKASRKHYDPIDAEIDRDLRKMDEELDASLKNDMDEFDRKMQKEFLYMDLKTNPPDWDERFGLEPYYLRKVKRQMRQQGVPEDEIHDTALDKIISTGAGFVGGLAAGAGKKAFEVGKKHVGVVAAPVKKEIETEEERLAKKIKEEETKLGEKVAIGLRERIRLGGIAGVGSISPEEAEKATQEEMRRAGISKAETAGLLATSKSEEVAKEQERFAKEQAKIKAKTAEEDKKLSPGISGFLG